MKNLLSIVVTSLLTISFFTTADAAAFKDVTLYHNEVDYLVNKKIIKGYEDGTFKPTAELNRLNAVQMILREKGITDFTAPNPNFTDLKPGSYGYAEVAKAVQLGFISGKTAKDGSKFFDAGGTLTRAQMAKILTEAYNLKANDNFTFSDVRADHWAKAYISRLATANVTTGYEDKTFKPENKLQRAHFAVFMARQLNPEFKVKPTPKPVNGQQLMTRAQAEAHILPFMTNKSGDSNFQGYSLMSATKRYSIIIEFPTKGSGKAQMSLDGVNYFSGHEIKPEDFGQKEYEYTKAHYEQMNNAIKAYAETQFGVGTNETKILIAEIKQMGLYGNHDDVKKITLQGKTVTIVQAGVRTRVSY
ncbi:S-layer homology domain-containing protein [Planococcus sp. CAU13]|uniref:S-layer homology domain-containing protein n=1 Tax=Planococcus sp. CAU13 TaxID=1541197 RepID=UPI00068F95A2|nr:S-layer homology domain-containing protein [Planococcus sp. CAU13]